MKSRCQVLGLGSRTNRRGFTRRSVMHSSVRRICVIGATVFFLLGFAGSALAQYPWQVGDVVVCYGGGKCNVLRMVGNPPGTPNFLNSLNDAGAGFGYDTNKVTIFDRSGGETVYAQKTKQQVAADIVDKVVNMLYA